jgi:hypothetical protein
MFLKALVTLGFNILVILKLLEDILMETSTQQQLTGTLLRSILPVKVYTSTAGRKVPGVLVLHKVQTDLGLPFNSFGSKIALAGFNGIRLLKY